MEVGGQLRALAALSQGKSPLYPLVRRLGGPESRSGRSGGKITLLSVPGIEHRSFSHGLGIMQTAFKGFYILMLSCVKLIHGDLC